MLTSRAFHELVLTANSDEEDETAELLRELEKIKKERAEQREREVIFLRLGTPRFLGR